jgi:hypothetical protein
MQKRGRRVYPYWRGNSSKACRKLAKPSMQFLLQVQILGGNLQLIS